MSQSIYRKLQEVLDTLPNGFPATESGVEIKLLQKIFTEEDAELFCNLKLRLETPEQIAGRLGLDEKDVAAKLYVMWKKGQVFMVDFGVTKLYRMMPWAFGIYEFQIDRMDEEFARLSEEYLEFGKQFFKLKPQLMLVVPVEQEIKGRQEAMPYEKVSYIIEHGKSFAVNTCICKKEKDILGHGCDKPREVCMAIAPVPGVFENHVWGRVISKEEAYEILKKAEDAALVHLAWNIQGGQYFICNCCGCCCGVLRAINEYGVRDAVNSNFYARIDPDLCAACGTCAEQRCQVGAISVSGDAYAVVPEKCIGCGLCLSTCPTEAISFVRKDAKDILVPPKNEDEWYDARAAARGVDFSKFK